MKEIFKHSSYVTTLNFFLINSKFISGSSNSKIIIWSSQIYLTLSLFLNQVDILHRLIFYFYTQFSKIQLQVVQWTIQQDFDLFINNQSVYITNLGFINQLKRKQIDFLQLRQVNFSH
ncbi:unnamed protein product [Paramecium sonneborni]|uniref:Uncharacterized protein n=1 Tax=Paramecium sonneborni TaxID=65129 RepID=A0A8S1QPB7_9CILI|nr:unnamed protein product [Paramecium sonneborni]